MTDMKIIVDAFGGDNAPLEIIKGCAQSVEELGANIILTGNEKIIRETAEKNNISLNNIEIEDCSEVITMEDKADAVLKTKKDSSMAVGFKLLNECRKKDKGHQTPRVCSGTPERDRLFYAARWRS